MILLIKYGIDKESESLYRQISNTCISILGNVCESEIAGKTLVNNGLSDIFLILEHLHKSACAGSRDFDGLDGIATVLELLAENILVQRAIFTNGLYYILLDFVDNVPDNFQELEDQTLFMDIRKNISRISTNVTMNDENMHDIPDSVEIISRFTNWLKLGQGTEGGEKTEDEIRMAGALCLGNLARSGILF